MYKISVRNKVLDIVCSLAIMLVSLERTIMAIIEDIEPPSKDSGGDKFFLIVKKYIIKITTLAQSNTKRAIFWLKEKINRYEKFRDKYRIDSKRMFIIRKNSPHIVILTLTMLVIFSNIIVRTAKADLTLDIAEPGKEINVSSAVDQYTPLISTDGVAVEKAHLTSFEEFSSISSPVTTNITQREEPLPDNSSETVFYTVKNGDTLTGLGWKFGVKLDTLRYLNQLSNVDMIKPGQKLKIPPEGYEVSASVIAKWEQSLSAKKYASSNQSESSVSINVKPGSKSNGYPWGWCTYYVASRRYVPTNWGNAKSWLYSAQKSGYSTGSSPASGAIVVTTESWWGHVAYVESTSGGMITIAEMNGQAGWGRISRRTIPAKGGVVRGYIY